MLLMLDVEGKRGIVHPAVFVVVIADGAIEHVIAEDHIEGFRAGILRALGLGHYLHVRAYFGSAGTDELPIYLNDAGVAGLNRSHEGRVIADMGNFLVPEDRLDQKLTFACSDGRSIKGDL